MTLTKVVVQAPASASPAISSTQLSASQRSLPLAFSMPVTAPSHNLFPPAGGADPRRRRTHT